MKLKRKDAEKICKNYNLGNLIRYEENKEGYVNYGFIIFTDKGKFMLQIIGLKLDGWKKKKLRLQFSLLEYLKKKNFPYEVPYPIKNKKRKYISLLNGRGLWVYKYIEGEILKSINYNQFKQIVKAIAVFHKYTRNFHFIGDENYRSILWQKEQYIKLKKMKVKNKLDKLMYGNIDLMLKLLDKLSRIKFEKYIVNHSDLNNNNVIFKNGKLVGIIDFDNVAFAPKSKDLGIALIRIHYKGRGYNADKLSILIKEYEKNNILSKKDKELILPCLLREEVGVFIWFYNGMKKHRDDAYHCMLTTLEETKKDAKALGWFK